MHLPTFLLGILAVTTSALPPPEVPEADLDVANAACQSYIGALDNLTNLTPLPHARGDEQNKNHDHTIEHKNDRRLRIKQWTGECGLGQVGEKHNMGQKECLTIKDNQFNYVSWEYPRKMDWSDCCIFMYRDGGCISSVTAAYSALDATRCHSAMDEYEHTARSFMTWCPAR